MQVPGWFREGSERFRAGAVEVPAGFRAGAAHVPEGSGRARLLHAARLRLGYAREASQKFL